MYPNLSPALHPSWCDAPAGHEPEETSCESAPCRIGAGSVRLQGSDNPDGWPRVLLLPPGHALSLFAAERLSADLARLVDLARAGVDAHGEPSQSSDDRVRPMWADPAQDSPSRRGNEDDGVDYRSASLDSWIPAGGDEAIAVTVSGYRHDDRRDWPDVIEVDNASIFGIGGVALRVEDARRLAGALLAACYLAETAPAREVGA